ncbi:restriction endonuclease subunit S [Marinomonas flavescens]|uniref:restriction endonuclease subunit S n=1 Tax=Marinomonas flavescens TaxID=2529379 RepID=UPI001055DB77|nr:restriction endonuclease subunit S [Marinomonas flavescens]
MGSEKYNFPIDWDVKPLVQCTSNKNISYGIVQPGQHDETGIGIIRVNNFENGQINTKDALKVSFKIENKFEKTRLVGGEVLLTLVGSTGQSAVVPVSLQGWNVARAIAVIRPSAAISAEWIDICLKSPLSKQFLDDRANTTVQKTLNLKDVKEIPIPLPPLNERSEIELIITNFDKKITLNRQINQTLEQMAQALFKSWFVDFDPVIDNALDAGFFDAATNSELSSLPPALIARAELRKTARASDDFQALPDHIRQLFPSAFEDSQEPSVGIKGWVPKGCSVKGLESRIKFSNGKTKKSDDKGKYPLYGANGIIGFSDDSRFSNAIIIGRVGAYCGAIEYCSGLFWPSDNTIVASAKIDQNELAFILYLLKHLNLNRYAGGAAQPLLNQRTLNQIAFSFSSPELLLKYSEIIDLNLKKIEQLSLENESLIQIRDILLPKLISGELRLDSPEVEQANALMDAE